MGAGFQDMDDDGRPDIFLTALTNETFPLFRNMGKGLFQEVTYKSRIGAASLQHSGWSFGIFDFDNDGWKDIFVAGSHVVDNVELFNASARYKEPCFFFHSLGNGKFENISTSLGADFQVPGGFRGLAVADYDNDGSLEAAVVRLNDSALLFKKNGGQAHHWLILKLKGRRSNRDAIGARIELTLPSGLKQYQHVTTANGIYSASDKRVHFGLGQEASAKAIEIRWPSGIRQTLENVQVDRILEVVEPEK
jgi:hypothetical protein